MTGGDGARGAASRPALRKSVDRWRRHRIPLEGASASGVRRVPQRRSARTPAAFGHCANAYEIQNASSTTLISRISPLGEDPSRRMSMRELSTSAPAAV